MKARWLMATIGCAVLVAAGAALTQGVDRPSSATSVGIKAVGPELVVRIPWGMAGATLGRLDGEEAASEGPMSFAVTADGTIWFLDQVRLRLAQFARDGSLLREIGIPAPTIQDFEVMPGGEFVLLDRLAARTLLVLDGSGKRLREVPVEGPGIPEGGGVTAMLASDDGIWLEFNHSTRVRVLDETLHPCVRMEHRGRAVSKNAQAIAQLDGAGGVLLSTETLSGQRLRQAHAQYDSPVTRIVWLQPDATGDIHVVFHVVEVGSEDPHKVIHEQVLGERYDSSLKLRATWTSPQVIQVWEQFREVRVHPDGTVYQMGFSDAGVTVLRWRWTS